MERPLIVAPAVKVEKLQFDQILPLVNISGSPVSVGQKIRVPVGKCESGAIQTVNAVALSPAEPGESYVAVNEIWKKRKKFW